MIRLALIILLVFANPAWAASAAGEGGSMDRIDFFAYLDTYFEASSVAHYGGASSVTHGSGASSVTHGSGASSVTHGSGASSVAHGGGVSSVTHYDCPYDRQQDEGGKKDKPKVLTQEKLDGLLLKHKQWVEDDEKSLWGRSFAEDEVQAAIKKEGWLNLCRADLSELDLTLGGESRLDWMNFTGAVLYKANLSNLEIQGGTLKDASLWATNLNQTKLWHMDFNSTALVLYEDQLPAALPLSTAKNLASIRLVFKEGDQTAGPMYLPSGAAALRAKFRSLSMDQQDRELTYAIRKEATSKARIIIRPFSWVFFDWTSRYGRYPFRPLWLAFCLAVVLIPIYWVRTDNGRGARVNRGKVVRLCLLLTVILGVVSHFCQKWLFASESKLYSLPDIWGLTPLLIVLLIYVFWPRSDDTDPDCIEFFEPCRPTSKIYKEDGEGQWNSDRNWKFLKCGFWDAVYFSLVSALRIGWRDLNAGSWITAMHPQRRRFRARGWIRFVAGFQSITTVYLIALSILSYFGHPFG